jgi:hypothetical protein
MTRDSRGASRTGWYPGWRQIRCFRRTRLSLRYLLRRRGRRFRLRRRRHRSPGSRRPRSQAGWPGARSRGAASCVESCSSCSPKDSNGRRPLDVKADTASRRGRMSRRGFRRLKGRRKGPGQARFLSRSTASFSISSARSGNSSSNGFGISSGISWPRKSFISSALATAFPPKWLL